MCVCVCVCVCVCLCARARVCSHICLKFIYNNSSSAGVLQALAISPPPPDHPSRPLLDAIRLNRIVADESPAPPLTPKT